MANILELMGLVAPQAEAEEVPALKKALGFNMMDGVKTQDPISKKIDKKEGTLVNQSRIQRALQPRTVSPQANEQAMQNVESLQQGLGLGNDEAASEVDLIVKALKDRLGKVGENSEESKRQQLNYQLGAIFTKNPLLQQLAQRGVASADEQTTGLQAKLLDALKTKSGIKKDEDAKTQQLYANQINEKYLKAMQNGSSGGASPGELRTAASMKGKIDNDRQLLNFDLADQGIAKAQGLFKNPNVILTPELFADAESDFVTALNQARKSSTGNEREKQSLHSLEEQFARFKQYWTSSPKTLNTPEHKKNMTEAMKDLVHSLDKARTVRLDDLAAGIDSFPSETIKGVVKDTISSRRKSRFSDPDYVYGAKKKSGLSDQEKSELEALQKEFGG